MIGQVPFGDSVDEPYDVYEAIVSEQLSFPEYFLTPANKKAAKMIQQLLKRSPEQRTGGSYAKLKAHSWFDKQDWDGQVEQRIEAPYIPQSMEVDLNSARKEVSEGLDILSVIIKM